MASNLYCTKMWYSSVHVQVDSKVSGFFSELRQVAWSWSVFSRLERIFPISQYEDLKLSERKLMMICTRRIKWRMRACHAPTQRGWYTFQTECIPKCSILFLLRCNWKQITVLIPNSLELYGNCRLITNVSSDHKLTIVFGEIRLLVLCVQLFCYCCCITCQNGYIIIFTSLKMTLL